MLYEMLAGRHPFDSIDKIINSKMKSLPGWVDKETKTLVKGLLRKKPQERMKTSQILEWCQTFKMKQLSLNEEHKTSKKGNWLSKIFGKPQHAFVPKEEEKLTASKMSLDSKAFKQYMPKATT